MWSISNNGSRGKETRGARVPREITVIAIPPPCGSFLSLRLPSLYSARWNEDRRTCTFSSASPPPPPVYIFTRQGGGFQRGVDHVSCWLLSELPVSSRAESGFRIVFSLPLPVAVHPSTGMNESPLENLVSLLSERNTRECFPFPHSKR